MKGLLYMKSKEQFIEILESFEEDQIDTPFKQSAHLCSETILSIDALSGCVDKRHAQRAYAARYKRPLRRLPRELRCLPVDFVDAIRKSIATQTHGICAEGICFNNAGSRGAILGVNLADQLRTGEAKFLKACVGRDAPLDEQRSHGAIATERVPFNLFQESHRDCALRAYIDSKHLLTRPAERPRRFHRSEPPIRRS